jgi:response regulator RpfG family c-di-GMP phosphodiesterase
MYDALVNETANKEQISKEQAVMMLLDGKCGELSPRMKECLVGARKELEELSI